MHIPPTHSTTFLHSLSIMIVVVWKILSGRQFRVTLLLGAISQTADNEGINLEWEWKWCPLSLGGGLRSQKSLATATAMAMAMAMAISRTWLWQPKWQFQKLLFALFSRQCHGQFMANRTEASPSGEKKRNKGKSGQADGSSCYNWRRLGKDENWF